MSVKKVHSIHCEGCLYEDKPEEFCHGDFNQDDNPLNLMACNVQNIIYVSNNFAHKTQEIMDALDKLHEDAVLAGEYELVSKVILAANHANLGGVLKLAEEADKD